MNDRNENLQKPVVLKNPSKKQLLEQIKNVDAATHLVIEDKKFNDEELNALGQMLSKTTALKHLELIKCKYNKPWFSDDSFRYPFSGLKRGIGENTSLTALTLDGCHHFPKRVLSLEGEKASVAHLDVSNMRLSKYEYNSYFGYYSNQSENLSALIKFLINSTNLKTFKARNVEFWDDEIDQDVGKLLDALSKKSLSEIDISLPNNKGVWALSSEGLVKLINMPSLIKLNIENLVISSKQINTFLGEFEKNMHCLSLGFLVRNFNHIQYSAVQKILARNLLLPAKDADAEISSIVTALSKDDFAKSIALIYAAAENGKVFENKDEVLGILFYLQHEQENTVSKKFDCLMRSVAHLEKCGDNPNAVHMLRRIDTFLFNKKTHLQATAGWNEDFWSYLAKESNKLSQIEKYKSMHQQQCKQLQNSFIESVLAFKMAQTQEGFSKAAANASSEPNNYGFFYQKENSFADQLFKQLSLPDVDPNTVLKVLEADNLGLTKAEQQFLTELNKMTGEHFQALSEHFMPSKKLEIKPTLTPAMSLN